MYMTMKYCKDCVHHCIMDEGDWILYHKCLYGAERAINKVTGEIYIKGKPPSAYEMRDGDECGGKNYKRIWWKWWRPR